MREVKLRSERTAVFKEGSYTLAPPNYYWKRKVCEFYPTPSVRTGQPPSLKKVLFDLPLSDGSLKLSPVVEA